MRLSEHLMNLLPQLYYYVLILLYSVRVTAVASWTGVNMCADGSCKLTQIQHIWWEKLAFYLNWDEKWVMITRDHLEAFAIAIASAETRAHHLMDIHISSTSMCLCSVFMLRNKLSQLIRLFAVCMHACTKYRCRRKLVNTEVKERRREHQAEVSVDAWHYGPQITYETNVGAYMQIASRRTFARLSRPSGPSEGTEVDMRKSAR